VKKASLAAMPLLILALLAAGVFLLTRPQEGPVVRAELDVSRALGGSDDSGFVRVVQPREFVFPQDHGPHPEYAVEWWYYTGNLVSESGRHFGYQLTLFRVGLAPDAPERSSAWAASQLYMGHFALTDVSNRRFHYFERFSRQALGLAGASLSGDFGFRVWLEDWQVEGEGLEQPTVRLRAAQEGIGIDLTLVSAKPVALQGDRGLSQKSADPGNASYYYSITRMPTTGAVEIEGQSFTAAGNSWMDREWSTSVLGEDQVGWDWFALQLSDGRDLMYYQLRREDGNVDPLSSGIVVAADGAAIPLASDDVNIQVLDLWDSPRGGSYPSRWRLQVPSHSIDVVVTPYLADQELDLTVRYWEGAVRLEGDSAGRAVTGSGYVELTGYAAGSGGRP
jgi:predicted secreted hydrolase